jgi:DNA modification methylase
MMTTDENDVVFDPMAGSNVVGRMSILMNRVALSAELSQQYHKIGCKMLEEGINDFDEQSLKFISSEVYRNDNDNQLPLAA